MQAEGDVDNDAYSGGASTDGTPSSIRLMAGAIAPAAAVAMSQSAGSSSLGTTSEQSTTGSIVNEKPPSDSSIVSMPHTVPLAAAAPLCADSGARVGALTSSNSF